MSFLPFHTSPLNFSIVYQNFYLRTSVGKAEPSKLLSLDNQSANQENDRHGCGGLRYQRETLILTPIKEVVIIGVLRELYFAEDDEVADPV